MYHYETDSPVSLYWLTSMSIFSCCIYFLPTGSKARQRLLFHSSLPFWSSTCVYPHTHTLILIISWSGENKAWEGKPQWPTLPVWEQQSLPQSSCQGLDGGPWWRATVHMCANVTFSRRDPLLQLNIMIKCRIMPWNWRLVSQGVACTSIYCSPSHWGGI